MNQITLTPAFKVIFTVVCFLTLLCLAIAFYLATNYPSPTKLIDDLYNTVRQAFIGGVGTILGLIGGKVT